MTNRQSDQKDGTGTSSRRRVGKMLFVAGLLLIALTITLGILVSLVAAYSGSTSMMYGFSDLVVLSLGIGLMLVIVGLVTMLLPEGPSEEWLWSIKTGPYIR